MSSRFPVYKQLLRLYPQPYRDKYASQMVQTLADMVDDQPRRSARLVIRLRADVDLLSNIAQQNIVYAGGIMSKETPYYVKRNALISTGLIIPFFVVVFFPGILRQNMSASAAFQTSLFISLILLPSLAFVLATTTFLAWSKSDKKPLWRGLLDVRRSWLLTAVGTLALTISLFVPFHDSVHCVVGNPVRVVHNPSQTWQCVDDGFLGGR